MGRRFGGGDCLRRIDRLCVIRNNLTIMPDDYDYNLPQHQEEARENRERQDDYQRSE